MPMAGYEANTYYRKGNLASAVAHICPRQLINGFSDRLPLSGNASALWSVRLTANGSPTVGALQHP
jgi:hypothetical protein